MDYVLAKKDYNSARVLDVKRTNDGKQRGAAAYRSRISDAEHFYPTRPDTLVQMYAGSNVIQCLSSTKLRRNMGPAPVFTTGGGGAALVAAHHILPVSVIENRIRNLNDEDKDFFDSQDNGIFLPTTGNISERVPYHNGNHPNYSGHVGLLWDQQRLPKHADTDEKQEAFLELIDTLRDEIADLGTKGRAYSRRPLDEI